MLSKDFKNLAHLHFIVLIWGFTAILGKLITVPAVELVFFRTFFAALGLMTYMHLRQIPFNLPRKTVIVFLLTGFIIAAHWITFFTSVRIANISVCLVGIATCSFWTSLIEPLATGRKIKPAEVFLGLLVVAGLYIIFSFDFGYIPGLLIAISSAILASVFTVINSRLARKYDPHVVALYEMTGASMIIMVFFPVYIALFFDEVTASLLPSSMDWIYIAILAFICTDYAYTASIHIMKRISAFTTNLTVNLEPVYGIILGTLIFGESEKMSPTFYIGASAILMAVLLHPVINRYQQRKAIETDVLR